MSSASGPFGSGAFGTAIYSNSPLFNTKTMIDAVLRDTGHSSPASETVKRQAVLSFINNRYATIAQQRHWTWLYSNVDINLRAPYTTGTIALTAGGNTVTGAGTQFDASMIPNGRLFVDTGKRSAYTIDSINSFTSLNITGSWSDDTVATASFHIAYPMLQLPSDAMNIQSFAVHGVGELLPIGTQELSRLRAEQPNLIGPPRYYTETARRAADGVLTVEVWPAPDQAYQCFIDYGVMIMKLIDSEDSFPLIPDRHRQVLYYGALSEMYRYLRDPASAQTAEGDFNRCFMGLCGDTQLTDSRLRFSPMIRRKRYRPYVRGRGYKDRLAFSQED